MQGGLRIRADRSRPDLIALPQDRLFLPAVRADDEDVQAPIGYAVALLLPAAEGRTACIVAPMSGMTLERVDRVTVTWPAARG